MTLQSRDILLKSRPQGTPTADNFEAVTVSVPDPGPGQVQVRNLWMTVDPYMRGRMIDRPSYVPPFQLGQALLGGAIGEVTASGDERFKPGDMVQSMWGWREAFTQPGDSLTPVQAHGLPPQALLGVAGMPGLTAYVGLTKVAQAKAGETVFVSAASGAVGSVVCQIAKIKGCTVIGSAGGSEKIAFLKEIGVDVAIDYKAEPDLTAALTKAAPQGIDVYFDNVGGEHLEAALAVANRFARLAICGMISAYNADQPPAAPRNLGLVIGKCLRIEGFIVGNHWDLMPEYVGQLAAWVAEGRVVWKETVVEGVEAAPEAFLKLFKGENLGKMLVKLG